MMEDPFLPFMEEMTEIGDELKEAYAEVDDLKVWENLNRSCSYPMFLPLVPDYILDNIVSRLEDACFIPRISLPPRTSDNHFRSRMHAKFAEYFERLVKFPNLRRVLLACLFGEDGQPPLIGGRRIAIVVSTVVLLYFVYRYLIGCIDRGVSKAGSSGSLEFRDIYISTLLFRAAYVWIKFRDVIPRGAVYRKPGSNKFEPRIKFPLNGAGDKSKRIPLGLYDTATEAEAAYRIAAFYCNKPRHCLGRLDLGGGAYFPIPALSVDPNLPYKEKVQQVGDQVLKVYAEFSEELKASRNLLPGVPGLAFDMPTGEGHGLPTSPIQQLRQPCNSGMDSAMQGHRSQPSPNIHNAVDFNNPGCFLPLLAKTQHELLEAYKQIECLNAQVSLTEVENMRWEVKYSELEQKCSEVERENELLNSQVNMQSQR